MYNFVFRAASALAPPLIHSLPPLSYISEGLEWRHHFPIASGFFGQATAIGGFLWGQRVPPVPPALLKYRICRLKAESRVPLAFDIFSDLNPARSQMEKKHIPIISGFVAYQLRSPVRCRLFGNGAPGIARDEPMGAMLC